MSLILATPSPQPPTTVTPLLIVSDTILGILFSFLFFLKKKTYNHLTFQVTVRTRQSFSKVHFKVEPSPSNVSYKTLYP